MSSHLGVIAVAKSANSKIGQVAATYVSQESCPRSCPFRGSGCYAETGMTGIHTKRLNRDARAGKLTKLQLAKNEARAVDGLSGDLPLRLHVVGDCTTNQTTKVVAGAAKRYRSRHNSRVWAYTHTWKRVRRASWGDVSVIASCETMADVKLAMGQGYAAAIVVSEHSGAGGRAVVREGLRVVPCPQQTGRAADCMSCGLCLDAGRLRAAGIVIEFATHGSQGKRASSALLNVIQ